MLEPTLKFADLEIIEITSLISMVIQAPIDKEASGLDAPGPDSVSFICWEYPDKTSMYVELSFEQGVLQVLDPELTHVQKEALRGIASRIGYDFFMTTSDDEDDEEETGEELPEEPDGDYED